MPTHHRPDFEALRKESKDTRYAGKTTFRDIFMWPYINLDDLVTPKTLLLFIKSRGRNHPAVFAHADEEATHLGRTSGALHPMFLNCYSMLFRGNDPSTYGRIYSWDEHPDAFDWMQSRIAMLPGDGLMVLEIQERILAFLVKCCEEILHDIPTNSLIDSEFPVQPEPPLAVGDESDWSKLSSIAAQTPYRVPASLDFARLRVLLSARLSAAQDHVRSLREDPGYFAFVVEEESEHRQERLMDTKGQKHPAFRLKSKNEQFWDFVLKSTIAHAYSSIVLWGLVAQEFANLGSLKEKYGQSLDPMKPLPSPLKQIFMILRRLLEHMKVMFLQRLKAGFPAAPAIRHLCTREPQDPHTTKIRTSILPVKDDQLMWLFGVMINDQQLHLTYLGNLTDELQRLIDTNNEQKARISPWLADAFGDLALVAELMRQINLFQPWASMVEAEGPSEAIDQKVSDLIKPLTDLEAAMRPHTFKESDFLDDGRFNYPSCKRRNANTTNLMIQAESNLDKFWEKYDADLASKATSVQKILRGFFTPEPPQRTVPWVESRQATDKFSGSPAEVDSMSSVIAHLELEQRTEKTLGTDGQQAKTQKHKTKGTTAPTPGTETPPNEFNLPPRPQPTDSTFPLGKRAYKVFSSLFYNPVLQDPPTEIPWSDFLAAMASMDFRVEKRYGSVWQFTPTKLDVERSIQVHEPHPVPKLSLWMARRIGRRLGRQYGWSGATFTRA